MKFQRNHAKNNINLKENNIYTKQSKVNIKSQVYQTINIISNA